MSDIIKHCPFCGGSADSNLSMREPFIFCTACFASPPLKPTLDEAKFAWNHRTHPPTGAAAGKDSVDAARYRFLRRRAVMVDYSDETVTKLTLFKDEGPTGEFLDDWVDGEIAAIASLTKTADQEPQ
jgi:hypothetical protein